MTKLAPSQQAWKFVKMFKGLKKLKITFMKQKKYIHDPKKLLPRIVSTDKKSGKPDSPWLYAAKVAYLMKRFRLPCRIMIGKFQDASKRRPNADTIKKMARRGEADCVWVEHDDKIYAAYGKNIKMMPKHYPLYAIGSLTVDSGHINRLAAKFYVNTEESPQTVQGTVPNPPDIVTDEPIDLRAEPDTEEIQEESKKGANTRMISPKYFTHKNSTTRKDIMESSFLLMEGVFCDKHNGNLIIVVGTDYDLKECMDIISEGWLSDKYSDLKQTVMKFMKRRAGNITKDNGVNANVNMVKHDSDSIKRKKVTDMLLDIFTTAKNGKPEFEEGTEELASALLAMVNNSDSVRFVKSGDRMVIKLDNALMQKFSEMKFKINDILTNLKDNKVYNVLGKQIKADYDKGTIFLRGILPENPGLAVA